MSIRRAAREPCLQRLILKMPDATNIGHFYNQLWKVFQGRD
jgi:hypothetical protein